MNIFRRAVIVGVIIEVIFSLMLFFGVISPCGPSSFFGIIGFVGHWFPGMVLVDALGGVVKTAPLSIAIMIVIQGVFWVTLSYAVFCMGGKRK